MRNLITKYTFIPGSRTITLPDFANLAENNPFSVENIRLIVNETQKVVICSSMQKDNVIVEGNTITYTDSLAPLEYGDKLTIEVDMGDGITYVDSGDWVVNAKLDALKPIEQQTEWVLDEAKARQLKPIVEGYIPYSMYGAFYGSQITEVKLSSWENINATKSCDYMFAQSKQLTDVDLSHLRELKNCGYMFEGCTGIKRINLDSVEAITGNSGAACMLKGCTSLNRAVLSLPNLVSIGANAGREMWNGVVLKLLYVPNLQTMGQDGWYSRGDALEVYAPKFITKNTQNIDLAGTNCVRLTINVKALDSPTANRSAIYNIINLKDLFIIGYPENNIYLSWQGNLNFNSVCGVLRKLCENTEASGLVCAFKAGFNIDDKTEWTYTDGDGNTEYISNPNGILKTLRQTATDNGWIIQNLQING